MEDIPGQGPVLSIGQLKFDEHISLTKIGKSDIL